jgi:Phage integrase family
MAVSDITPARHQISIRLERVVLAEQSTDAARRIGVPGLHPHELRHTAASLSIASGADVKVVQQMLGHKSATMTLDLYGHLFEDRLDDVADRLDQAVGAMSRRGAVVRELRSGKADAARTRPNAPMIMTADHSPSATAPEIRGL